MQPSRLIEDYKNIRQIGQGGFGTVFYAKHRIDKKDYAIKRIIVRSDHIEDVLAEVTSHACLDHHNVVRYSNSWRQNDLSGEEKKLTHTPPASEAIICKWYSDSRKESGSSGNIHGYLYIAMELCEEYTLANWLKENTSVESRAFQSVKWWMRQLLDGMCYIHENKLIHRDLKPGNIFFKLNSHQTVLKIGDFGLVATQPNQGENMQHTSCYGTWDYMAPEQRDNNKCTNAVDVFAMGLIFIELLYPFETDQNKLEAFDARRNNLVPEVFSEVFKDDPKNFPGVSKEDLEVSRSQKIEHLLQMSDPNKKYRSYFLFNDDLPEYKPLYGCNLI